MSTRKNRSRSNTLMSGADVLIQSLKRNGIKILFGVPGVQLDNIFNSLYREKDNIRLIHTRQEQGAAYMAYGYAHSTGQVGVFLVVPGPGILNTPTALCTAFASNSPVLALTGNIPSQFIDRGLGILHEVKDQGSMFQNITKWHCRSKSPSETSALIDQAFNRMQTGRKGPVLFEMPIDVTYQKETVTNQTSALSKQVQDASPDPDDFEKAAKLLGKAKNPIIYIGGGTVDSGEEVRAIAEALEAPVVATKHARGVLTDRHYLSHNLIAGEILWRDVDIVLAVGTRLLDPYMFWGIDEELKIIRIDVDPVQIDKPIASQIRLVTSSKSGLSTLSDRLVKYNQKRKSKKKELNKIKTLVSKKLSSLVPQREYSEIIRATLPDDGILVPDVTQLMFYTWFGYPVYSPRTLLFPGYQDSLGYAFATALGVKVAHPNKIVLCITGDGGFMLTMPELATAVQYGINLVTVIFNDSAYGNVRRIQKERFDGNFIASELQNPDFVSLAQSFGAVGMRAENFQEFAKALKDAFEINRPVLIDVPVGEMPAWQTVMPRNHIRGFKL